MSVSNTEARMVLQLSLQPSREEHREFVPNINLEVTAESVGLQVGHDFSQKTATHYESARKKRILHPEFVMVRDRGLGILEQMADKMGRGGITRCEQLG
mmetsp:Transcript_37066/g.59518  ORF Transcript_37066/g.59518 Transcript_37066/m.59518 type:complete len:99 (+) Transcript_37066:100-396(+)